MSLHQRIRRRLRILSLVAFYIILRRRADYATENTRAFRRLQV